MAESFSVYNSLDSGVDLVAFNKESRIQDYASEGKSFPVPRQARWKYKLEPNEVLKVTIITRSLWGGPQSFIAKLRKDDRILVHKLIISLLSGISPVCALRVMH